MKKNVIIFSVLVLAVLGQSAQASENQLVGSTPKADSTSSADSGLRVSLVSAPLTMSQQINVSGSDGPGSYDYSQRIDSNLGVSLGWRDLPAGELGWTSNVAILSPTFHDEDYAINLTMLRLDGNLAYKFNNWLNFKAGPNVSAIVASSHADGYPTSAANEPRLGFQASLGAQIWKSFGVDVGYSEMHTAGSLSSDNGNGGTDTANFKFQFSGFELALTADF